MGEVTRGKRRRFGPFRLGRRCKHAAVELGPIHEAHNVRTGTPALVFTPGTGSLGRPKRDWLMRVHVRTSPPSISLEVERAPISGRLSELKDAFLLLLAGLDAVGRSARVRDHLTREHVERPSRWPLLRPLAVVGVAVLALGGTFWLGRASHSDVALSSAQGPQPSTLTDGPGDIWHGVAYPLPDKPFRNQVKAPCDPKHRSVVAINGGCWVTLERRPPCDEETEAEYKGKCYMPVLSLPPTPRSVGPGGPR